MESVSQSVSQSASQPVSQFVSCYLYRVTGCAPRLWRRCQSLVSQKVKVIWRAEELFVCFF